MEDDIYKINDLSVNQQKTEFCLSYNNGLKTFDIENFKEKAFSNSFDFKLGSISFSVFLNDNIIILVGTKYNKDYPPDKLVFFDITNKKEISSKKFEKEITNIKYVNNYLYVCIGSELKIYSLDKNNELELKTEYNLCEENDNLFEVWETKESKNDILGKIYLAYPYKKDLIILFNTIDDWKLGDKNTISSPVDKIQNLFYIRKINQLFITDENAYYIYGLDADNGKVKLCLKRGNNPGIITSITLLNNNFLAVNNLNKTIHIFDLDINNNAFSLSNIMYNIIYGIQEIYPCLRIYFKDLIKGKEAEFNKTDFKKKGGVLVSEDEGNILNIIAYNGFAYKVKINFKEHNYEMILKTKYSEKKNLLLKNQLSIYNSNSDFIENDNTKETQK